MAKDVDQIVIGSDGTVWVAPVGTAAPVNPTAVPGAGWVDLGYTSEDGATLRDGKTLEAIRVWQLAHAARQVVTERKTSLEFVLRQWSVDTVKLAFGGGSFTEPAAGVFRYAPPAPETVDERALMLDWQDGAKNYRLIIVRGIVTENVETNLRRAAAGDLPITFSVLGADTGDPWYLLTDDPALDGTP